MQMIRTRLDLTVGHQDHIQELIEEFIETLSSLSKARLLKYRVTLTKMSNDFGKAFDSLTRNDLHEHLEGVSRRGDYPGWTRSLSGVRRTRVSPGFDDGRRIDHGGVRKGLRG